MKDLGAAGARGWPEYKDLHRKIEDFHKKIKDLGAAGARELARNRRKLI